MIRYAQILPQSVVDGPGLRVVCFLQGCPHRCEGCHNPRLQPGEGGITLAAEQLADLMQQYFTPLHRGVTFSGGEPLAQPDALLTVIKRLQRVLPRIDIWVYTGYVFEEVRHFAVMRHIDVLVDGPFAQKERDLSLAFRGSRNQRLIDVPQSIPNERVVLWG